jgi:hypothetical protein
MGGNFNTRIQPYKIVGFFHIVIFPNWANFKDEEPLNKFGPIQGADPV